MAVSEVGEGGVDLRESDDDCLGVEGEPGTRGRWCGRFMASGEREVVGGGYACSHVHYQKSVPMSRRILGECPNCLMDSTTLRRRGGDIGGAF